MYQLILSSNNRHKVDEIKQILSGVSLQVCGYSEVFDQEIQIVEDGQTFEENAIKKVQSFPQCEEALIMGDDSGLEVDALDGRPGIFSARYAGEGASSTQLCQKILSELEGIQNRQAQFVCVLAIRFPDSRIETITGLVRGHISYEMKGKNGFGYDPIFIPEQHQLSFAQMTADAKHALSHRGRALIGARQILESYL